MIRKGSGYIIGFVIAAIINLLPAVPNVEYSTILLSNKGFCNVQINGNCFYNCGIGSIRTASFTAQNDSKKVNGCVCRGILKEQIIIIHD